MHLIRKITIFLIIIYQQHTFANNKQIFFKQSYFYFLLFITFMQNLYFSFAAK